MPEQRSPPSPDPVTSSLDKGFTLRKAFKRRRKFLRSPMSPRSSSPCSVTSCSSSSRAFLLVNPLENLFNMNDREGNSVDGSLPTYTFKAEVDDYMLPPCLGSDLSPSQISRSSSPSSTLWLSPHQRPPSKEERNACYARLNSDLGPPRGIQQQVRSYQTFMMEQSRVYYERILPDAGLEDASASVAR